MSGNNPWLLPSQQDIPVRSQSSSGNRCELREWKFSIKTITFWVSLLQFVILYLSYAYVKATDVDYICVLYSLGAKYTPAIRYHWQIWRLFNPVMLHADILHLIGNLSCQLVYGFILEPQYGTKAFAMLYWMAGMNGNLLSAINFKYEIGVGASGAIFGLMGLETVSMVLRYKGISFQRFLLFIGIIGTAFLSLFENNNLQIDVTAHIGGMLTGILLGVLFQNTSDFDTPRYRKLKLLALVLIGVFYCVVLSIFFLEELKDVPLYFCIS